MSKYLLLLISFFLCYSLEAQNTAKIKGQVLDEHGVAIYAANVVVDAAKGWAAASDFDGNFSIDLPAGTYTVLTRYIGYENSTITVELKSGETKTLTIKLQSSDKIIGPVDVYSPTKRGISKEKEVVSVETISTELIQNNNITLASDAVDKVTGVTLLDGQVSIRGGSGYAYGSGSRVILVIDEIPLLSPERNEVLWDFVPMENVRSIDVVKGASSVQYGSAALNGIVAVSTNWPTKKKETNLTMYNSIYSRPPIEEGRWWNYSTDYVEAPHEMGLQFAHLRKLTDEMDLVVSGAFISSQSHIQNQANKRVRNNIKWRFTPANIPGLSMSINSNLLYRNNDQFFIWNNNNTGAYQGRSYQDRYVRYSIDPVVKYFFKDKNQLSFINRIYADSRLSKGEKNGYFGFKIYNDFQYKRTYNNTMKDIHGTTTIGAVNTHDIITASSFKDFSRKGNGVFHFNTASIYSQSDFGWKDLTLALGARFDYIALDGTKKASKPVFNAGVSYEVGSQNFVRFGFGQSFRIPSIAERFVKEEITSVDLGGSDEIKVYAGPNPFIRPESGYSFELGFKKKMSGENFNVNIDASLFYQYFTDMTEFTFGFANIDPRDSSTYTGFQMLNVAQARIFGWEGNVSASNKIKKAQLTYSLGYTYSYAANAEEDPNLQRFFPVVKNAFKAFKITKEEYQDFYEKNDKNVLYGMLRYRFRHTVKADFNVDYKKWSFGTNIRYYSFMDRVDAVFALFIPGIQDYRDSQNYKGDVVVDVRANYHFSDKFSLGILIKNAFNNDYQLRPAKPDAPRSYTMTGRFTF